MDSALLPRPAPILEVEIQVFQSRGQNTLPSWRWYVRKGDIINSVFVSHNFIVYFEDITSMLLCRKLCQFWLQYVRFWNVSPYEDM